MRLNRIKEIIYALCTSFIFYACQADIFEGSGKITQRSFALDVFDTLEINDDIHVKLYQSDSVWSRIEAPDEWIENIELQLRNGRLTINNLDRFNWLKSSSQPYVHIYAPDLKYILHKGYGDLQSEDTLKYKYLKIFPDQAYGSIDLIVNCSNLIVDSNASSVIRLKGQTDRLFLITSYNDGKLYADSLNALKVYVNHRGESVIKVKALDLLQGEIWNTGDLIYTGKPDTIDIKITGKGRLINQ